MSHYSLELTNTYAGKSNYSWAMYAYALGYYCGRAHGAEDNPYDQNDKLRPIYTKGYERGVADYCDLDEGRA